MAYEVVIKKRFTNKFQKLIRYLEAEWGTGVAEETEKNYIVILKTYKTSFYW